MKKESNTNILNNNDINNNVEKPFPELQPNPPTEEEEFPFLYEKLIQTLERHAFLPLEQYTASEFKKCDTNKILTSDDMTNIKNIFNSLRSHYIDQIREEIKNFVDKYNLKEKLEHKTQVFFYTMMMQELGLSLKDLEEIEELNNLDNDNSSTLKYYVQKFTQEKNKELEEENDRMRVELKMLKIKNNLNL